MTVQRQERYGFGRQIALIALRSGFAAGLAFGLVLGFAVLAPAARAATTERVVANRYTGLAIDGFDPVAYFVQKEAVAGLPDYEVTEAGVVWRFHNEGNRASFVAHPEIYGPQFGGYDPTDVARGVAFAGNPHFFIVFGQRLYLFGVEAHRDAFAADPEHFLSEARERWPQLERTLSQ
jgi:hypothetical protein